MVALQWANPFLVWKDQDERGTAFHEYRRILDDFARSSFLLTAPLAHQTFQVDRPSDHYRIHHFELVRFHIPSGTLERQLFEHAYGAFRRYVTLPSSTHLANCPAKRFS